MRGFAAVCVFVAILAGSCSPSSGTSQPTPAPSGPQALLSSQTRDQYLRQLMAQLEVQHTHFANVGVAGKVLAVHGRSLSLAVDPLQIGAAGKPAKIAWVPDYEKAGRLAVAVPTDALLATGGDLGALIGQHVIVGGPAPSQGQMIAKEVLPIPRLPVQASPSPPPAQVSPKSSAEQAGVELLAARSSLSASTSGPDTANIKLPKTYGLGPWGWSPDVRIFGPSQCGSEPDASPALTLKLQLLVGDGMHFNWPMTLGLSVLPTGQLQVQVTPQPGSGLDPTANWLVGFAFGIVLEMSTPCEPGSDPLDLGVSAAYGIGAVSTAAAPLDGQPDLTAEPICPSFGVTIPSIPPVALGVVVCETLVIKGAGVAFNVTDASDKLSSALDKLLLPPSTSLPLLVSGVSYKPTAAVILGAGYNLGIGIEIGPVSADLSTFHIFAQAGPYDAPPPYNPLDFYAAGPFRLDLAGPRPPVSAWQHLPQDLGISDSTLEGQIGHLSPPVIDPDHGQILAVLPEPDQSHLTKVELGIWQGSWTTASLPDGFLAMAYDPSRHQVIALSEQISRASLAIPVQSWSWDGRSWHLLDLGAPAEAPPVPGLGGPASLVYDPTSQTLELVSVSPPVCCGGAYAYSELGPTTNWKVVQCGYMGADPTAGSSTAWQSCGSAGGARPSATFDQLVGPSALSRAHVLGYDPRLKATLGWVGYGQGVLVSLANGYWQPLAERTILPAGEWSGAYDATDQALWIAGYDTVGNFHLYRDDVQGNFRQITLTSDPTQRPPTAQPLPLGVSEADLEGGYLNGVILPHLWTADLAYDPSGQQLIWLSYDQPYWTIPPQEASHPDRAPTFSPGFVNLNATTWTFSTFTPTSKSGGRQ